MKAFLLAVGVAAVLGVGAWLTLDRMAQKPVETAFTTSAVRL
jgi:hypothetical protein